MKKNEQYFSCFSYADRIAGVNVGPSQQWTNPCLLASGVLPSDTGKGDANKVSCFGQRRPIYKWFFFGWLGVQLFRRLSSLPCKKKKHNCTCPDPIQSEEWSREWPRLILTQQAHTTKPAVVAQKQASILCWLSPTWPHMTERWNGPTIWWVRHCTWWQEDENDSWCKNCIFLQTILFFLFSKYLLFLFQSQLLWLFFEVLAKAYLQGKSYLPNQVTANSTANSWHSYAGCHLVSNIRQWLVWCLEVQSFCSK